MYLDHAAAESAHFASAAAGALDSPVPHLGDWKVSDLVAHLGQVYSYVITCTSEPGTAPEASPAPAGDALNEWFGERRATLLATLSGAADDAPAPSFAGEQTVGWWKRRMAHETTVHRWDAEATTRGHGVANPIDSDLATDGIDEYLAVGLRRSSSRPDRSYPPETLHLHRSDGPGEWMLVGDGNGGLTVTHEHGKGDAAVRGPASDLVLWIWGRPATNIEIFGDEAVARAWQALAP